MPLQFVDAFPSVGAIQEILGAEGPKSLMSFQFAHDLQFTAGKIHIDPVASANGAKRTAIKCFRNEVAD